MKRFRYTGTEVQRTDYDEELPEFDRSYAENYSIASRRVSFWVKQYPKEWEEVFDTDLPFNHQKPFTSDPGSPEEIMRKWRETGEFPKDWNVVRAKKPLHKETDLGYFSGLAMQGILSNEELRRGILMDAANKKISPFEAIQKEAILEARELIKQLDSETK